MKFIVFEIGGVEYGININVIKSIEQIDTIIKIPGTLKHLVGITNLRGNVLPIYSLMSRFEAREELGSSKQLIIASLSDMLVAFEIKQVSKMLEVEDKQIIRMPSLVNDNQSFMNQVIKLENQIIVILDVDLLIEKVEKEMMKKVVKTIEEKV